METTLILGINKYVDKKGRKPLYLRIAHNKKRKLYPIGIKLEEIHWNEKKQILKPSHEKESEYNLKLLRIQGDAKINLAVDENYDVQAAINRIFYETGNVVKKTTNIKYPFVQYFEDYVKRCQKGSLLKKKDNQQMSSGYILSFDAVIKRIKSFEEYHNNKLKEINKNHEYENFVFDDLTVEWQNRLITFLRMVYKPKTYKLKGQRGEHEDIVGLMENSIGKTIKHVKTVIRQAVRDKLTNNMEFEDFTAFSEIADSISLTPEEVEKILALDLTDKPHLKQEQERFAVAYNFLFRFTDSMNINKNNIYTDESGRHFLRMTTQKTGSKIDLKIRDEVYKILSRKDFKFETANQTSNENVKTLGALADINYPVTVEENRNGKRTSYTYKKYQLITTHTTRRSAATNLWMSGMDIEHIRRFGGWADIKQLQTYLKIKELESAKKSAEHPFFQ